ncbi:MAG: nucleoside phosphorylase [Lachnospiraceae bacterium]|nr:nucleoside phosphorylase [Lachnospiraceae bacterium]
MALIKHEIPILEYDDCQEAVIMPGRHPFKLPKKAVFAFLSDCVDEYARAHDCPVIEEFESATKMYPVYCVNFEGQEIALCQAPVGSAPATQILDWLIAHGVEAVISAGSCGALVDLPENTFLVPARALRDEGTSYHYLAPSRFVEIDREAMKAIETVLIRHHFPYRECITWTTDGFFRETREKVEYRRSEGCAVVEMECAALEACAKFRGAKFGQILFTADTLADMEHYDERGWGGDSFPLALLLCLEAAAELK